MDTFKSTLYNADTYWCVVVSLTYLYYAVIHKTRVLCSGIDKKYHSKVGLYCFYIPIEFFSTVVLATLTLPNVFSMMVSVRSGTIDMKLIPDEFVIIPTYYISIVFVSSYLLEMVTSNDMKLEMLVHHVIVILNSCVANYMIRVVAEQYTTMVVFYTFSLMILHATLDWLIHVPLLLRRLGVSWNLQRFGYFNATVVMMTFRVVINLVMLSFNWNLYEIIIKDPIVSIKVRRVYTIWLCWIHIMTLALFIAQVLTVLPFRHMYFNKPARVLPMSHKQ